MGKKANWSGVRGRGNCRKNRKLEQKFGHTTSTCYRKTRQKIKKAIEKTTKTKKTLKCSEILQILNCFPNFLGCFAQDSIDSLFLQSLPCTFIVNVDSHQEPGSHWLAVALFEKSIEIFDPLGFKFYNWKSVPCQLLKFIQSESLSKKLLIAPQLQPLDSQFCAFYCIYFVFHRHQMSFEQILSHFSLPAKNDRLLYSYFLN